MSQNEREILEYLIDGKSRKTVCKKMGITAAELKIILNNVAVQYRRFQEIRDQIEVL
ncbi:MAG: hypothetical protein IJF16_06640 [Clostridia bacterium]|nr:hypothetical protein [Clostridia bacterium]